MCFSGFFVKRLKCNSAGECSIFYIIDNTGTSALRI